MNNINKNSAADAMLAANMTITEEFYDDTSEDEDIEDIAQDDMETYPEEPLNNSEEYPAAVSEEPKSHEETPENSMNTNELTQSHKEELEPLLTLDMCFRCKSDQVTMVPMTNHMTLVTCKGCGVTLMAATPIQAATFWNTNYAKTELNEIEEHYIEALTESKKQISELNTKYNEIYECLSAKNAECIRLGSLLAEEKKARDEDSTAINNLIRDSKKVIAEHERLLEEYKVLLQELREAIRESEYTNGLTNREKRKEMQTIRYKEYQSKAIINTLNDILLKIQ